MNIKSFVVCFWLGPLLGAASAQTAVHISVNEPRPLGAALGQLEKTLSIPINYEDPRFACRGDVEDVTDVVQSGAQRAANPNVHIIVPRGGSLKLDPGTVISPQTVDALTTATQLRIQHEADGYPGRFNVKQIGSIITVEPIAVRDSDCSWTAFTPAMETKISFASETRPATETLWIILSTLSQRLKIKVGLAGLPMAAFADQSITLGANEEPANSVMVHLFEQLSVPGQTYYSYHMLYDPGVKYYMLAVNAVPRRGNSTQTGNLPVSIPPPVGMFGGRKN